MCNYDDSGESKPVRYSQIDIQPILFALLLYSPVSFSVSFYFWLFVCWTYQMPNQFCKSVDHVHTIPWKMFFFLFIFLLLVMNLFGWKYVDLNILTLIKSTKQINKFSSN